MNLRVDILLPDERRSASPVSLKGAIRITAITVPLLLIVTIGMFVNNLNTALAEKQMLSEQWAGMEQRKNRAVQTIAAVNINRDVLKELDGWTHARVSWHTHMSSLIDIVPENIQLQTLRVSGKTGMTPQNTPGRMLQLSLRGISIGAEAEPNVYALKDRIESDPAFEGAIQEVKVGQFGSVPEGMGGKMDRIFQFDCPYKPREFK